MADCLFCNMAQGETSIDKLFEDDLVFAIRDIRPRAPVHFMVIPKEHIPSAAELRSDHGLVLSHLFTAAARVALEEGLAERGYRLTLNVGPDAGMTVHHLHLHCLGGRALGPEG